MTDNRSERVKEIILDCLYRPEQLIDNKPPKDCIMVKGIMTTFGFNPERVDFHKDEIKGILDTMAPSFHMNTAGGMSFLNLCMDKGGVQWTGMHRRMDELCVLGIACGMANYIGDRDFWKALPGGMPFVVFNTKGVGPLIKVDGIVKVEQLVSYDELDLEDRDPNLVGGHVITAYVQEGDVAEEGETLEEKAILDKFHATVPISCLDDFNITVTIL